MNLVRSHDAGYMEGLSNPSYQTKKPTNDFAGGFLARHGVKNWIDVSGFPPR